MSRLHQSITGLAAIAWGVVPVWFYATDRIGHYLQGEFQTIALIGGLGMIVLGLFNVVTSGEEAGCGHQHDGDDHEHGHSGQNSVVTLALMVLPVIGSVSWTQDQYSDAALRRKTRDLSSESIAAYLENLPPFTLEALERNTSKTPDGHYQLDLTQLFWSAGDAEFMNVFDGLPVEIEAQLMAEEEAFNPRGDRMRLFRLFMNCCAADAQVIGITAEFSGGLPNLPERAWVRIRGTVAYETIEGRASVLLKATSQKTIDPPFQDGPPGFPF